VMAQEMMTLRLGDGIRGSFVGDQVALVPRC
jgi:hypothetical protein